MPERIQNNDGLMLLTCYTPNKAVLSVTTPDAFSASAVESLQQDSTALLQRLDQPPVFRYRSSTDGSITDARFLSFEKPEGACASMAAFLSGQWLDPALAIKETTIQPAPSEAYPMLCRLLNPILSECSFKNVWNRPLLATEWREGHPAFMKDLDKIFSALDLLSVQRHRQSVTQGEASVLCCGKEVVRYGDDQWLKLHNGRISNGFREKDGVLYGEVINGWGSAISDAHFRRAALVQFADRVSRILVPTKALTQLIDQAKRQTSPAMHMPGKAEPEQER